MKGDNVVEKTYYGVQDAKTGAILGLFIVGAIAVYAMVVLS
jgi:hypothetical protein